MHAPPPAIYVAGDHEKSEMQLFVLVFNQDFDLLFPDFRTAAHSYMSGLTPERQGELRRELARLLAQCSSDQALKKAWLSLGAQWMPKGTSLRHELEALVANPLK